jgi:hypothetical protein
MKLAGLLLLPAGWAIVLTALVLLPPMPVRSVFVLAGVAVEALGLILVARAHIPVVEERAQERR